VTPTVYRVIVAGRAFDDLNEILSFVAQESPQNSARLVDVLYQAALSLCSFPARYPVIQGGKRGRPETRAMPVGPYLMYYRVLETQKQVRVLAVRHAARRRPRRLG
jgi:plasmid stabilization system protein ParE